MNFDSAVPLASDSGNRGLPAACWRGRRVTVMGLGTHGGGAGATRFLARHGARIRLTDLRSASELSQSLREIRDVSFESVRLGWHDAADFLDAEAVVVNPAVPFNHPLLQLLRQQHVQIVTEAGLVWQHTTARVVAVTGSVGKSTTATMIDGILRKSGRRTWLGGNIGGSLLHDVDSIKDDDWLVLELSSFQLAYLAGIGFRPDVAVVTNFSPNHLDWHGSLSDYRQCKQQILRNQSPSDIAILDAHDADVMSWPCRATITTFGSHRNVERATSSCPRVVATGQGIESTGFHQPFAVEWTNTSQLSRGPHQENAACAVAACLAMDIEQAAIISGLKEFVPLPHRFENLGMYSGRIWINDSKATTPAAALAAIHACDQRPWVLLGGANKQIDMTSFCASIAGKIGGAALLGETGPELHRLLQHANSTIPLRMCKSMSEAVGWLAQSTRVGDVVLLSPACASLDHFRDYADRGEQFRQAVMQLDESARFAPAA